jgi:glycosyltransferase involved in cell wall biosynthesis
MMKIGIDYFAASTHAPGIGRYGRELVRALVRLSDCPELLLWSWGRGESLGENALGLAGPDVVHQAKRVSIRLPQRAAGVLQKITGKGPEALCGPLDIFHRMTPFTPALGRSVAHRPRQVQPLLELPAPGSSGESELRNALLEMDAIVCGSRAGAQQAIEQLGLPAERVHAVTTGADHWLRDTAPLTAGSLQQAGPPQLLVLGAISEARRPLGILSAFEALIEYKPHSNTKLVFCGRGGDLANAFRDALAASPVAHAVSWIDDPVEEDLPALVAGSTALIHMSAGELSPITPLEALTFGAAVVASDLPAFREVLATTPGAFLMPSDTPDDPAELARAMQAAIESGVDQSAREQRMIQAQKYTWRANAEETLALWRALTPPRS